MLTARLSSYKSELDTVSSRSGKPWLRVNSTQCSNPRHVVRLELTAGHAFRLPGGALIWRRNFFVADTDYFSHPLSDVATEFIGPGTRVWQYVVVQKGAVIGADCNVGAHCFIEEGAVIGDRVTIKNGVQIWDGLRIEDDVFVGPNVTFTNDRYPKSRVRPQRFENSVIRRGSSLGGGCTLLPGIEVGEGALVGAGAVVTQDVLPFSVVAGNPARIIGKAR